MVLSNPALSRGFPSGTSPRQGAPPPPGRGPERRRLGVSHFRVRVVSCITFCITFGITGVAHSPWGVPNLFSSKGGGRGGDGGGRAPSWARYARRAAWCVWGMCRARGFRAGYGGSVMVWVGAGGACVRGRWGGKQGVQGRGNRSVVMGNPECRTGGVACACVVHWEGTAAGNAGPAAADVFIVCWSCSVGAGSS